MAPAQSPAGPTSENLNHKEMFTLMKKRTIEETKREFSEKYSKRYPCGELKDAFAEVNQRSGEPHYADPSQTTIRTNPNHCSVKPAKKRLRLEEFGSSRNEVEIPSRPSAKRAPTPPRKQISRGLPAPDKISLIDTRDTAHTSEWYNNISIKRPASRQRMSDMRELIRLVRECRSVADGADPSDFGQLRQKIHAMSLWDIYSPVLVKTSKILESNGLRSVFDDEDGLFPWDMKVDAKALYLKLMSGDLDTDLLRGIEDNNRSRISGKDTLSRNLAKSYPHRVSCAYHGQGDLHDGQWWPFQICAKRDGAHGEIEAGIHGHKTEGAYSVVLSSGGYADEDEGEHIKYCGTAGVSGKPSAGTKYLIISHETQHPVRVLRSYGLPKSNQYRPQKGLRYDGLYEVEGFDTIDKETEMHQFILRRMTGQFPIRWQGTEARPTNIELAAYEKKREFLGLKT